jgi:hypothetical protein
VYVISFSSPVRKVTQNLKIAAGSVTGLTINDALVTGNTGCAVLPIEGVATRLNLPPCAANPPVKTSFHSATDKRRGPVRL